ncbi:serine/threonine-protein kinase STY46 isoform X2 [Vicia villosa]|uniref:serine/threonine-protein kinase STY46 isoform X2 n=1 Tax=Vicia villosa TaxID=3911 RepID=UPI00273CE98F|nr:serine/threonine-protein kinase STY46 isoform X2 [Vicia villosa]
MERQNIAYQILVDRCRSLEEKQVKLTEQFNELMQEKVKDDEDYSAAGFFSGFFFSISPYANVLKCMGHAVHIHRVSSGEIIYWNDSAETLYGWRENEIIGQRVADFLVAEEYYASLRKILQHLITGVPWSGQFPFKKRSGEIFMAMVTKTPFYEGGELVGVITVSSDASVFNSKGFEERRTCQSRVKDQPGIQRLKRIQWPPRPQIASSVPNVAARVLAKLRSGRGGEQRKDTRSIKDNCTTDDNSGNPKISAHGTSSDLRDSSAKPFSKDCCECSGSPYPEDPLLRLRCPFNPKKLEPEAMNKDEVQKQQEGLPLASSKESIGDNPSSSSKEKGESNSIVECDIHWEDLQLRKEIGQGSYAVVYHGIWNASDVAVKVYFGNGYAEETLRDYKKEVDIMKRLRHPNVLLFMGAIYSQERHAIVTELLPRGSLFRTLHKNNQTFDIRRHLRMALDVARGMNYLHHRNPPIVHRDLKSSNLLVDKNWNVKVGDFGLSKLKEATLLTTKSGRGTFYCSLCQMQPQWMAPEVLRSEPSNEKSDVFSYGVVLWEIMTQSIPWKNLNSLQVVGVVGFMNRRLDLPEGLDPHVASIINDCWQSDPEQRPSFEELVQRMMLILNRVTTLSLKRIAES